MCSFTRTQLNVLSNRAKIDRENRITRKKKRRIEIAEMNPTQRTGILGYVEHIMY